MRLQYWLIWLSQRIRMSSQGRSSASDLLLNIHHASQAKHMSTPKATLPSQQETQGHHVSSWQVRPLERVVFFFGQQKMDSGGAEVVVNFSAFRLVSSRDQTCNAVSCIMRARPKDIPQDQAIMGYLQHCTSTVIRYPTIVIV